MAEALIEVPTWVGHKIIHLNGTKVAGQIIFVEKIKICKFGNTCNRPCTFYHLNVKVRQTRDNVMIDGFTAKNETLCANNGKHCKWIVILNILMADSMVVLVIMQTGNSMVLQKTTGAGI